MTGRMTTRLKTIKISTRRVEKIDETEETATFAAACAYECDKE